MTVNMRREPRRVAQHPYSICWRDEHGLTRSAEVQSFDCSHSGVGFRCQTELRRGLEVFVQSQGGHGGYATVRHCTSVGAGFTIGVELDDAAKGLTTLPPQNPTDYYEFLQISPKAESATIQRVYRFLAGRYHPDNPATGDSEKFLLLKNAFEVLSDPDRRAAYDARCAVHDVQPNPTLESIDYMDGIEGEVNRRLAVLSLLYSKRRTSPEDPRIPLADLERRMGFPREYLDFATWYLRSKKYITKEDNSDFALTALGVDFVAAIGMTVEQPRPVLKRQSARSRSGSVRPARCPAKRICPTTRLKLNGVRCSDQPGDNAQVPHYDAGKNDVRQL